MLHYAAAYGNYHVLRYLLGVLKQTKNKDNLYPWEIAVGKGHLSCAVLLESNFTVDEMKFNFSGNILLATMKNLVGTDECIDMVKYLVESTHFSINCQDYNGFTPLHYCCSLSEEDYIKTRIK
jgi:ankyrin repeat protein